MSTPRNFTPDNGGDANDVTDGNGMAQRRRDRAGQRRYRHGARSQAGAAQGLPNNDGGSFEWVAQASPGTQNYAAHNISAVCMSLGDGGNYPNDGTFSGAALAQKITALRQAKVAVVVAAGNDYFTHGSHRAWAFPASSARRSVSARSTMRRRAASDYAGAEVLDARRPDHPVLTGLHNVNRTTRTEIFAPGAPGTSSGMNGPHGESVHTARARPRR